MKNIRLKIIGYALTVFLAILISIFAQQINAAEIYVSSKDFNLKRGEQFKADIFINSEGKHINAIEGEIVFPDDLVDVKNIQDGGTIVSFWIDKPHIKSNSRIIFSGITPGGYAGDGGLLFSVIFNAKREGNGLLKIRNINAFINDGKGTKAKIAVSNFNIIISKQKPGPQIHVIKVNDSDKPEIFKPKIGRDPSIFGGKYFLVFSTQDKGSGVGHYEVCESGYKCMIAESPYLLLNQKLDREIIVKAIDKNGNERKVILPPPRRRPWHKSYLIFIIIIAIIIYVLRKLLYEKGKR